MITLPAMTFREWNGPLTADLVREPARFGLGQLPSLSVPTATTKAVCGFCSTGCGLKIHLKDGEAINLTPDAEYPVNLGTACPKGWEALSVLDAPDRARMPILHGKEVDWDTALREQNGNVNALGLYDLDRNIRRVGQAYKQLIRDWHDVLPAQSVCLVVPIVTPAHAHRVEAAEQQRRMERMDTTASAQPSTIEDFGG